MTACSRRASSTLRAVELEELTSRIRDFTTQRDWDQFHTPRNLLLALVGEVGELAELLQWKTDEEAAKLSEEDGTSSPIAQELADVFFYLLRLADVLDVPLGLALMTKLDMNAAKYPAHLVRGNAAKYTEYGQA